MIMLDEFNRLGKMPIVVESIETLRTYRGHLAVVTQTIPPSMKSMARTPAAPCRAMQA